MPDKKKRTILFSEDSSKVDNPSWLSRAAKHLKEKSKVKSFGLKYKPTKTDSIEVGARKRVKAPKPARHRAYGRSGGSYFGIEFKKKF
jgi:hypothetical protein